MISRCLILLLAGQLCARGQDAVAILKALDRGFSAVFEKVAPSVVVIEATKVEAEDGAKPSDFFRRDDEPRERGLPDATVQSEGSGFFVRADGYIATNRHVVLDSSKISVRGFEGQRWDASLIAEDERTDIAVLKVTARDVVPVQWGDSEALRVGQLVGAIGAPFNQDYSFTCGWVSGKGRSNLLTPSSGKPLFEDYIQTDAFINPGNSGGPLFDVEGRVVGMNTLINGLGRGLAFAIPSNLLRDAVDQLIATGRVRRPWLGVRLTSLENSAGLREQFPGISNGVVVNTIEAGTPAAQSDLRPGDLITAVDGTALRNAHELVRYVQRRKIGEVLKLSVFRRGETIPISIATAEQPEGAPMLAERQAAPPMSLGLNLSEAEKGGVLVGEVMPGSAAARAGLRTGDVITEIGSESVADPKSAIRALQKALAESSKNGVMVQFERGGKKSWGIIERISH